VYTHFTQYEIEKCTRAEVDGEISEKALSMGGESTGDESENTERQNAENADKVAHTQRVKEARPEGTHEPRDKITRGEMTREALSMVERHS